MAGVFKNLDKGDIRNTPFRAYKLWSEVIGASGSGSIYTIYQADYNPVSSHLNIDPLRDVFDQGNPVFDNNEPATANNKLKTVVHTSINRLYYKYYYTNNYASYGGGQTSKQFRLLEDQAQVISLPQTKFGEEILPGSVKIFASWSFTASSGSYTTASIANRSGSWTIIDDSLGNLLVSGSNYLSVYGQYVGGAYTEYASSVQKLVVGEWPIDELYKYDNIGPVNFTSKENRGVWPMTTTYNNIAVITATGSVSSSNTSPNTNLLGATMHFTASISSSLLITSSGSINYNKHYSFENGNYTISMMVKPTQAPTNSSGSVIICKQGVTNHVQLDLNGNQYTQQAPTKFPWKLIYATGSKKVLFEINGGGYGNLTLTSSISMSVDTLYHVAVTKTGSLISLYVNGLVTSSVDTTTTIIQDKHTNNLSNIIVGNSDFGTQGFNGTLDNIKIYNQTVSSNDIKILHHTLGVGNVYLGNAFYSHGMIVLGSIVSRNLNINKVESRGTRTIYEQEVSCTVSPGDFNVTFNKTVQEYNALQNQFVFRPFVTGSTFKPYITTIGLYDNQERLLVVGKLSVPIQTPSNMDTTFIVRYDR